MSTDRAQCSPAPVAPFAIIVVLAVMSVTMLSTVQEALPPDAAAQAGRLTSYAMKAAFVLFISWVGGMVVNTIAEIEVAERLALAGP